ncbi:MAG TPA: hypothetical protein VJK25_00280 [Patescibacteria group bacterium]|nr:hypothetical protein [Patescibacteria group bacterium]
MTTDNFALTTVKYTILALAKHLIYWPVWWYTAGFLMVLKSTGRKIGLAWQGLALDVWLANIFRPMYGQYDIASRIISFIMRGVQIIVRFVLMVILTVLILIIPVIYLALPILVIWRLTV